MRIHKAGVVKKCLQCNKEFLVKKSASEGRKYCSSGCKFMHRSGMTQKCLWCKNEFYVKKSLINISKYCSRKCYNESLIGKEPHNTFWKYATKEEKKERLLKLFNKHVIKNENTDTCWGWKGFLGHGYGVLEYDGKFLRAHRASYMLFKGPIPEGKFVCHRKDCRHCTNPEHLFIGDQQDNMNDMYKKGRSNHPLGEKVGTSKLKEVQVIEIRKLLAEGVSTKEIANKFKIGKSNINEIKNRNAWKHI